MGKTIMIVDDAEAIRKSVAYILQKEGYEITESKDGEEALRKLNEHKIDLVICDVNMPKIDGIAFLKAITTDTVYSAYKFTPIIMLTTESSENLKAEGLKLGAKVWIVKPFKPEELVKSVKLLIS